MEEPLRLKEWKPTEARLTPAVAAEIQALPDAHIRVEVTGERNRYLLTPESTVGVVRAGSLQFLIEPKIDVDRFFALLSYSREFDVGSESVSLGSEPDLFESFAKLFLSSVRRLLARGAVQGYVSREEALNGFRGRLRAGDQVRRRFGMMLPLEVTYDDFTIDVEENRLLKAALLRLARFRFEDASLRRGIGEALAALTEVSAVRYPSRRIPQVPFNRLNQHYRGAVELARLLLQNTSVELRAGEVLVGQFLVNMNDLFEDFVYAAIGRRLPPVASWLKEKALYLDEERRVRLEPDLSWWRGGKCLFVGDAKYKRTKKGENHDLYQLLAYCEATGRREGMLIYAEGAPTTHVVRRSGVRLEVAGVDLEAPLEQLEARLDEIAAAIAAGAGISPAAAVTS